MTVLTRCPMTMKEREALLWALGQIVSFPTRKATDRADPLFALLEAGHERDDIMAAAHHMHEMVYDGWLSEPLTPLELDILRVAVENSSWIDAYRTGTFTADSPIMIEEALATLRDFAVKLEAFGIEISHIPHA